MTVDYANKKLNVGDIFTLVDGQHPQANPAALQRNFAHKKHIKQSIIAGQPPKELNGLGLDETSVRSQEESRHALELPNGWRVTLQTDLETNDSVISLKPGNLRGRDVVQLGFARMAAGKDKGAIYLFDKNRTEVFEDLEEIEPVLISMATKATEFYERQQTLKMNRRSIQGASRQAMGQKAVELRIEVKEEVDAVHDFVMARVKTGK